MCIVRGTIKSTMLITFHTKTHTVHYTHKIWNHTQEIHWTIGLKIYYASYVLKKIEYLSNYGEKYRKKLKEFNPNVISITPMVFSALWTINSKLQYTVLLDSRR